MYQRNAQGDLERKSHSNGFAQRIVTRQSTFSRRRNPFSWLSGSFNAADWNTQLLYAQRHLPQGAPTSPALANLCAYRVDCRLSGLAAVAGASYTRYADDVAFSGDEAFARCAERFSLRAAAILLEEGFAVRHRKTRLMQRSVRQHLAGLVVNERLNVRRADFDELKAILTNCCAAWPAEPK